MRNDKTIVEGKVIKSLSNAMFLVEIKNKTNPIICYISGKMRIKYIKVIKGDIVKIEYNKQFPEKARIIYRISNNLK